MKYDSRLQILTPRINGLKPSQNLTLFYESANSPSLNEHEAVLVIANHYKLPSTESAQETGRIEFSITDTDWQDDILAKEVFNKDPLSLGQDSTADVSFSSLHGFTVESVVAGGERHILLKLDEAASPILDFQDLLVKIELTYPANE